MKLSGLVLNLLYGWNWSWIFYASFLAFRVTRITGLYHQVWHKSLSIWRNLVGFHIPLSFHPVSRSGHPLVSVPPSPPSLARSSLLKLRTRANDIQSAEIICLWYYAQHQTQDCMSVRPALYQLGATPSQQQPSHNRQSPSLLVLSNGLEPQCVDHLTKEWGHGGAWFESSCKQSFGDAPKQYSYSPVHLFV